MLLLPRGEVLRELIAPLGRLGLARPFGALLVGPLFKGLLHGLLGGSGFALVIASQPRPKTEAKSKQNCGHRSPTG
jgi:hypothetical protein